MQKLSDRHWIRCFMLSFVCIFKRRIDIIKMFESDIPAKLRDFKTYTQDVKVEIRKIANSTRKAKTDEKKTSSFRMWHCLCMKCEVAFYLSWEVQQPFM